MPSQEPEKGDKVSWNWGGGAPGGTVAETKKEGELAITSKRGNKIKKKADPENPAVHVARSGNDVVKRASELKIEKKTGGGGGGGGGRESTEKDSATDGEKRKHGQDGEATSKKHKDDQQDAPPGNRKAGRPKKGEGGAATKSKKPSTPRAKDGIGSRTRSQQK